MDVNLIPFGQEAMTATAPTIGERVIDIGCGIGDTSFEIARRVGPSGHVRGVDISEMLLAEAGARAASTTAKNVTFTCGDAQTHNFEPAALDIAFSRFGGMFFDDPIAAYRNIRSALKPGGRIAFICWQPAKDNEWISLSLDAVLKHLPSPPPSGPEDPGPLSFGDAERVMRILSGAGFSKIAIEPFKRPFTVGGNLDEAVAFLTQMGPASGVITRAEADDATRSRIAADLRDALAPYETGQGVALGSATWIVSARNP